MPNISIGVVWNVDCHIRNMRNYTILPIIFGVFCGLELYKVRHAVVNTNTDEVKGMQMMVIKLEEFRLSYKLAKIGLE